MPINRSYTNPFEVTSYTREIAVVPNSWTLLNDVGLFQPEYLTQNTVTFEETNSTIGLITDKFRGEKPTANKDDVRKIRTYAVPHFPAVDFVLPEDIQGKRAYGTVDAAETEAAVIARKMTRMKRNYDVLLNFSRFKTLTTGNVFSPNGTISGNFFNDYSITQTSVDFVLGTATTDLLGKIETIVAAMQDNAQTGDIINGVVCYASPEFFSKLIIHPRAQTAFQYYTSTQEPLRQRAGGMQAGLYREFQYGSVLFKEVRDVQFGERLIPAGEAVFVPVGTSDNFVTYFSPAAKFGYVNTVAEPLYVWTTRDVKGEKIEIDAESNFINVLRRPQLVCKGTTSN